MILSLLFLRMLLLRLTLALGSAIPELLLLCLDLLQRFFVRDHATVFIELNLIVQIVLLIILLLLVAAASGAVCLKADKRKEIRVFIAHSKAQRLPNALQRIRSMRRLRKRAKNLRDSLLTEQ